MGLVFLILAGLANLLGAWLFLLRRRWEGEALRILIASGAGFMLAVALMEMAPEAQARTPSAMLWLLIGFLLVHLVEHVLTPHFHYGDETHVGLGRHVGISATLGLTVHAFLDGVAIVGAAQTETGLAWLVFLAMVWHKIPGGFTAASVTAATGGTRRSAFIAGATLAVASVGGGLVYGVLSSAAWIGPALALSAGSLIYVAATDLLPEVNKRRTIAAPLGVLAGVAVFYVAHLTFG